MGPAELGALSLGLSVATAATAWMGGRVVEALSDEPRLRDRMWGMALILPVLPPLAVGLMLLTPAPVREMAAPAATRAIPPLLEGTAASPIAAAAPALAVDAGLIATAALTVAGLLVLARTGVMALRLWRLVRLIGRLDEADTDTMAMVEAAARALSTPSPRVGVSGATPEPLLVGFARPRLILPAELAATADAAVVRAVIAHELAHLKRGDHRALWLEEILLAVLAFNPLAPALRARRAAAREEACDALALAGAAVETRRAYAETLIEALRSRAGPQPLPALTFTGAGRKTAMRRLRAVMTPAAPAGRRAHLLAASVALALLLGAGAGSLAVAGEREAVVRVHAPTTATAPGRSESTARPQAQPAGAGGDPDTAAEAASRRAAEENFSRLTPEQQARFRNPTATEYQAICTSGDPADGGFCAGVIFSQLPRDGGGSGGDICLPPELEESDEAARRAALGTLVERTRAKIVRASVQPGDSPAEVARAALARVYSCEAAALRAEAARMNRDYVPLTVSVDVAGGPLSVGADETLRVVLTDETGAVVNTHGTINRGSGRASGPLGPLGMALHADDFPRAWESTRVYTLTGEIRGPGRVLRYVAEPVTLRLAPGARRSDLRPTLSFRPA